MPVLYAHSGHLYLTACEARDRAVASAQKDANAWPSDAIVAIILSATSTEAFINELVEFVVLSKSKGDGVSLSRELLAFAGVLEEIEDARGSLALKYLMASQTLGGTPFDKGANPFQDFSTLITLRNDIMHLKPRDILVSLTPEAAALDVPKYVVALQQRGLARTPSPGVMISWFNRLQTSEMAVWATQTARAIILAVLALIPDDPVPTRDPAWMFKTLFRNPPL